MSRLLVICFDGLNRKAVEKYNLKNIMQVEYGDVVTGAGMMSGALWTTLITGEPPAKHKIHGWYSQALNDSFYLDKLGFKVLVRYARNPIVVYYPFLDERWPSMFLGIEHLPQETIIKRNTEVYEESLEKIQDPHWDLFLVCFMIIDNLYHYGKLDEGAYRTADRWVKNLKEAGNPEWTLVLGDKGTDHRPPGFYSSSKKLSLSSPNWRDFYKIIMEDILKC